jgi:hypothetical protein
MIIINGIIIDWSNVTILTDEQIAELIDLS